MVAKWNYTKSKVNDRLEQSDKKPYFDGMVNPSLDCIPCINQSLNAGCINV
jgi:hypothetical protein